MNFARHPLFRGLVLLMVVCGGILIQGCRRTNPAASSPPFATTTSYLEAAARDLLGVNIQLMRLAEPGTCPGHFDMRPSQIVELRRCRVLLRFDFQKSLDAKLAGDGTNGPRVAEIALRGGMCRPESYRSACCQVASNLVALGLLAAADSETRLHAITNRLDALSREATNRIAQARLVGLPVIASQHQRDFCEWLGLKVVATIGAADTASIAEIEAAIATGKLAPVKFVIANLPEGRRIADALAERLQARVVVFENFPALRRGGVSFDEMFSANLEALRRTAVP
jgi:zinc transport system substrate-binding protein